ncbi:MAG: GGDEF domain-containing protein [Syntrophaceae bacterium]|nr:GGDEF domain-containing protein [Syntrophaceae bacterium]
MEYSNKTREELIEEINELRLQLSEVTNHTSSESRKNGDSATSFFKKYRRFLDKANEGIFVLQEGCFVFVSQKMAAILGASVEVLEGFPFVNHVWPEDRDYVVGNYWKRVYGETAPDLYEFRFIGTDGRPTWIVLSATTGLSWNGKPATLYLVTDINERKQAEERLKASEERYRELSLVDELTQLYNARHFYQQLQSEIDRVNRYCEPLTLLLLDLDNFKAFNDTYGHVNGDAVLSRFGQVMKRCLRQTDSAFRYGGEEFTVLLPMTTAKDGAIMAERIRMEFNKERFSPNSHKDICMTASIGVAQYKIDEDMKSFIQRADQLMYLAKKNGKNRVSYK